MLHTKQTNKIAFIHYDDVIMSALLSEITSPTIVYSTVYSRRRSKKTSKLRVTGLCAGNSSVTGEFHAQRASNAENVSIWWRHHDPFDFRKEPPKCWLMGLVHLPANKTRYTSKCITLQMTFSVSSSCMKIVVFSFKFELKKSHCCNYL